jgi:putative transposase
VSAYRFIVKEKANHSVRLMCAVLKVSASGFYDWCARSPSDRALSDQALLELIRRIFRQFKGRYGSPRIWDELRDVHGVQVSRKRVERLMRVDGLTGKHQRKRRSLTKQDKKAAPAPDLLGRGFAAAPDPTDPAASPPGARMVGDITYLATGEGWLYLADVLDLTSRAILGYAMAEHMRAELVVDALTMAAGRIELPAGAIFHSDRGSQYTSTAFADVCTDLGVVRSMGRTGSCFDNSAAESFWATLKTRARSLLVANPRRSPPSRLRIHRDLLQPAPTALRDRHHTAPDHQPLPSARVACGMTIMCPSKRGNPTPL